MIDIQMIKILSSEVLKEQLGFVNKKNKQQIDDNKDKPEDELVMN